MKAAVASESGLVVSDVPQPKPKPAEVLVRVRAAGLNRADLSAARGAFHPGHGDPGQPLGLEWAGDVVEVGSEVTEFRTGDRVMCSGIGGYAEYAVSDIGRTLPDTARHVTALLYTQLAGAAALSVNMIHLPPRARIAARLLFLAGNDARNGCVVGVTQSQLAELTGLSRKTVNGHLAHLAKKKLVLPLYGGMQLDDLRALRDLAAA